MTADHNWFAPMWNQPWNVLDDDWFAEYNSTQDVTDSSVRRLPHLLQIEFFNASFVRCDGCALNADAMLLNRTGAIDGDLVVGRISVLNSEVVVLKIDIKIRQDQLLLDEVPDDAGHFIAIELNDGSLYFDLAHLSTFRALDFCCRDSIKGL